MKLSRIALAVASGVLAMPAFAIVADTDAARVTVRVSGATAQDGGVLEATLKMCKPNTLTAYTASNQFVYYCNAQGVSATQTLANGLAKIDLPDNTKLAVHKHSVGGSGNGVTPIDANTLLPYLNLSSIAGPAGSVCPTPVATTAPSGAAYTLSACTSTTGIVAPVADTTKIGISDVEPSFFGGPADYDTLTAEPLATVVFGVPVTKVVYNLLQAKQKTDGIIPATCPAGDVTEVCMPSLSTGQITSLYTQTGQNWTAVAGITVPGDNTVYVARRVDTSGTQKTYEAVIARTVNGNPTAKSCQVNVDSFVSGPAAADNNAVNNTCNGAELIVNNSGSGQVLACLNRHQDGITSAGGAPVVVGTPRGAVGTLTTEAVTSATTKFLFVKVNGKAPTLANVNSGEYTLYGDASLNTKTGALAGVDLAYYNAFKKQFAISPVPQPFGNAGLESLDVVTGTTGGNPYSRLVGTEVNNCQQGRLIF